MIQLNLKILFTKIHKKILKYNFSIKLNTWYDFYIFLFFLFYILLSLISIGERRRKKKRNIWAFNGIFTLLISRFRVGDHSIRSWGCKWTGSMDRWMILAGVKRVTGGSTSPLWEKNQGFSSKGLESWEGELYSILKFVYFHNLNET